MIFPNFFFFVANSADPDEMPHYVAFICVFSVRQSTRYGVSGLQRVKKEV